MTKHELKLIKLYKKAEKATSHKKAKKVLKKFDLLATSDETDFLSQ